MINAVRMFHIYKMDALFMYGSLCARYYDLDRPYVDIAELNFYLHFIQRAKGPLLEPMCGSGRLMIPLLQHGFHVQGFDTSVAMLNLLRKKISDQNLGGSFWEGSIQQLERKNYYEAVLVPAGSLNLITDAQELKVSLECLYCSLVPGGLFVFELITSCAIAHGNPHKWVGNMHTDTDGSSIIMSTMYVPIDNGVQQFVSRYELVHNGVVVTTEIENIGLRFYEPSEMVHVLENIGFTNVQSYKAYDHTISPDNADETVMIVCMKP